MDATVTPVTERVRVRGNELAVRIWPGEKRPFVLVHGLASNANTWNGVGRVLNAAGHQVVAVDQRGHGLSDKPDDGFNFDEVTADLKALIEALSLAQPVVAGQSWGGNVVLDFAARHPEALLGLVLVDGGFIELSSMPDATWEKIEVDLRPPNLIGTPRVEMMERMRRYHGDWSDEQIEMQFGNFETLEDGTIRPWLTLDRHMKILRSLWEQRPSEIYEHVQTPTLIAVAGAGDENRRRRKENEVATAEERLPRSRTRWFENTEHDIHVHRPEMLADWMLEALDEGFFNA